MSISPDDPLAARQLRRSRLFLALGGVAVLASAVGFSTMATRLAGDMEARAIAGTFPHLSVEEAPVEVDDNGRVSGPKSPDGVYRYVASQKLIGPGKYAAVVVAYDDDPQHRKKSELVIAARDLGGQWHPATAPQMLEAHHLPNSKDR